MLINVPTAFEGTVYQSATGRGTDLTYRHVRGYVVFDLDGPLTLPGVAEELSDEVKELVSRGERNFVINLGGVPNADSVGIGALVACRSAIREAGGKLVLLSAQRRVREMLKRMRLDTFFTFSDDEGFALRTA